MPKGIIKMEKAERDWWLSKKEIILSEDYRDIIKDRSKRVEKWLQKFVNFDDNLNILEIGGGPTQLVDYFSKGKIYALDPMADVYSEEFATILNPEVEWKKGISEKMPYENEFFDIIISRNVLDHVNSVTKTLSEIHRVLKKDGLMYLGLNTFSGISYLHKLIVKDPVHPFVFSPSTIKSCMQENGFYIVDEIIDAPENMSHFSDKIAFGSAFKVFARDILLYLKCFHFSEFLLKKH